MQWHVLLQICRCKRTSKEHFYVPNGHLYQFNKILIVYVETTTTEISSLYAGLKVRKRSSPNFWFFFSIMVVLQDIWKQVTDLHVSIFLTGGNWQKWKRVFLTCPCHEIYRDEAVGLKSCKNTWKITIFVKMWNLGQYRENLIFCR